MPKANIQPLNAGSAQWREVGREGRRRSTGGPWRRGALSSSPACHVCLPNLSPCHSSVIYSSSPSISLPPLLPPRTARRAKAAPPLRGGVAGRGTPSITAEAETVSEATSPMTRLSCRATGLPLLHLQYEHMHIYTHTCKHKAENSHDITHKLNQTPNDDELCNYKY